MEPDKIITEARARIIWGESPLSVRSYLTANGVPAAEADAKIKEFNAERNAEIRKMGFRRVLLGAGLLVIAGIVLYVTIASYDKQSHANYYSSRGRGGAFGMGLLAAFYGLWKLVNGVCDLVRPQSEEGSIPDMDE